MPSSELLIGGALALGLGYLWFRGGEAAAAEVQGPQLPQDQQPPQATTYDPRFLSRPQQMVADKILVASEEASINPAFMLALAVTESSLRPTVVGDDGVSFGLFQIQLGTARDHRRDVTRDDLLSTDMNISIAMQEMRRLMRVYPGFPLGDYAEAWTLGGRGRFVLGRRNLTKLTRMHQAISDLKLDLLLSEVAT
ncbi:MAG: transglycosylase SLT domain-containing protein [Nitrospirota bacterium]|nr:transglycosylase SLT domain-containing protein [Nitrospirota bacterium]